MQQIGLFRARVSLCVSGMVRSWDERIWPLIMREWDNQLEWHNITRTESMPHVAQLSMQYDINQHVTYIDVIVSQPSYHKKRRLTANELRTLSDEFSGTDMAHIARTLSEAIPSMPYPIARNAWFYPGPMSSFPIIAKTV